MSKGNVWETDDTDQSGFSDNTDIKLYVREPTSYSVVNDLHVGVFLSYNPKSGGLFGQNHGQQMIFSFCSPVVVGGNASKSTDETLQPFCIVCYLWILCEYRGCVGKSKAFASWRNDQVCSVKVAFNEFILAIGSDPSQAHRSVDGGCGAIKTRKNVNTCIWTRSQKA